jgi:Fe-S-cluster containining protein
VKWVARQVNRLELGLQRRYLARKGEPRYRLTGTCNGCGKCCERPSIQLDRFTWHLRGLRAAFLFWQRHVNGFELDGADPSLKIISFRCTHYDPKTRTCDSYDSRPHLCRDYPVNLTYDAIPALFPECSHAIVDKHGPGLISALEQAGLSPAQLEAVRKKLNLG